MTTSTGTIAKLLMPGLKAIWGTDYEEHPREYTDLFDVTNSDKAYEEYVERAGLGLAPIKPEGIAVSYDNDAQGTQTRITNVSYGMGFIITREAIDDNQYERQALTNTADLAFSLRQTEENVAANVYNRAITAGYTGGDGKVLLAVDHTTLSGSQSNMLATAADLSEASLEDMCIQIMNATNSRGLRISLMPKSLVVPTALLFEATRIVKSTLQNDSANNAVNALRALSMFPDGIKVNHYLTDLDAWFVRTNLPSGRGMVFQNRTPAEFGQDSDFDTSNIKAKAFRRFATGWVDFRGVYGSMGA